MATRTYCDNCGNTIHTSNVFCFGPYDEIKDMLKQAYGANVGLAGSQANRAPQGKPHSFKIETVDLCDRCVSTWMERVRKLTNSSEPDA